MSTINNMLNTSLRYTDYGKLASGNRIQSASDDPAGSAIASKQEAQERGSAMEARNKASEVDMANIADGALAGTMDYLQRTDELSIQALNGTNSESDVKALTNEMEQMASGIDQIGSVTKYNETNPIAGTSARSLGVTQNFNTDDISSAIMKAAGQRAQFGARTNGLEAGIRNKNTERENTMAGLSRNKDLDIGKGVQKVKKRQTLQQAAIQAQRRQQEDEANRTRSMFS